MARDPVLPQRKPCGSQMQVDLVATSSVAGFRCNSISDLVRSKAVVVDIRSLGIIREVVLPVLAPEDRVLVFHFHRIDSLGRQNPNVPYPLELNNSSRHRWIEGFSDVVLLIVDNRNNDMMCHLTEVSCF